MQGRGVQYLNKVVFTYKMQVFFFVHYGYKQKKIANYRWHRKKMP